jgi:hypothetical protein
MRADVKFPEIRGFLIKFITSEKEKNLFSLHGVIGPLNGLKSGVLLFGFFIF